MVRTQHERFGLEHLEPRQFMAAVSWDGGGGDTNWNNPLNWSGDVLPTLADDVTINDPSHPTIQIASGTAASAKTLSSWNPLNITGGELNIYSMWWQNASLAMSGGRVTGAGNGLFGGFTFDGDVTWTGGTIDGGAGMNASRHVLIDGDVTLGRSITIYSSMEWRSGNILLKDTSSPEPQFPLALRISQGATMLIRSSGSMSNQTPATFINNGTLIRDGAPNTTTTISVKFDNGSLIWIPFPTGLPPLSSATVDVRAGTLSFTGEIVQKTGSVLFGGSSWLVSGTTGRLLLPGPLLTEAQGTFLLNGPGSSFPALENASSITNLTLSGGRQWTFSNYDANLYGFSNLTIDNPGMTTVISGSNSPGSLGSLRADNLVIKGGRVDIVGLMGHRVEVQADTVLVLSGISRLPYADVSGAGLIRLKGELNWPSGTIAGPGQLVITETGHLTTTGQYYEYFNKTLTRRVINRGVMDISESTYEFRFSGEIANRGVLNMSIQGYLSTSLGIDPGSAPGFITNMGTINSYASATLRGASGGIRINNQGTVHVASGVLILNGGSYGGGNWIVDANAELVFGGFGSILVNPNFSGNGRIREASAAWWTNATITGGGDFIVTVPATLALLGTHTTITRSLFTNNGRVYMHDQSVTTINGNVVNNANLDVNTGILNVNGNINFKPTSSLSVHNTGPSDPVRISVTGYAEVGGSLRVVYTWVAPWGSTFDFLYAVTPFGNFQPVTAVGNDPFTIPFYFQHQTYYGRVMLANIL